MIKLIASILILFLTSIAFSEGLPNQNLTEKIPNIEAEPDWKLETTLALPFRGFEIQTTNKKVQTQDPLGSVSYSPSPELEGKIYLRYKLYGFSYSRTLLAASLDSAKDLPSSKTEAYRFNILFDRHLFELSQQNLVGMSTDLDIDGINKKRIARPDIKLVDTRFRWVYGLPVWGSDQPNSLANFYTQAAIPKGEKSIDLLASVEFVNQDISGDSAFIPIDRQAVFGAASTLSKISSTGLGAGVGFGFTVLMQEKSYFSIGGLIGGNLNNSKATFNDRTESISGFGSYMNAWMAIQMCFDSQNIGFRLDVDSWTIPAKENTVNSLNSMMAINYGLNF